MLSEISFNIGKQFDPPSAFASLDGFNDWHHTQNKSIESTFYDTFDWRLHHAELTLASDKSSQEFHLYLYDNKSGRLLESITILNEPDFSWNLPNVKLINLLTPLLGVRRLLPMIRVERRVQYFSLFNKREKIILRARKENIRSFSPLNGTTKSLRSRLCVEPLKGYAKFYKELVKYIRHSLELTQAQNLMTDATTTLGVRPGFYSSKLNFMLYPAMRSDAALKQFLSHLLGTMEINEVGIEADWDTEFLHDFRVSVRRSRSAIGQIKQVMPIQTLRRLKRDFSWLNEVTGPCRDMDVYLLAFPHYQDCLPQPQRAALEPLWNFLLERKKTEYKKMIRGLHSARYRNFKSYLHQYLATPVVERTTLTHARQSIKDTARQRIWHVYHRVITEGNAIYDDSPNEALHKLRKTCKKLRYLLEFSRSLFPEKKIAYLIKVLKQLQTYLGEFQDYSVQIHALQGFSQQMSRSGSTNNDTLEAINQLATILGQKQQKVRNTFHARFSQFSSKTNTALFEGLFHHDERSNKADST
jgi:CHAD domain-containing protein